MSNKYSASLFSLLLCFFISTASAQQQQVIPPGLDEYINKVLQAFQVPGISVGIVKDGKVILAKGYGVKKLGDPSPVDENTLFSIASNSKAFTATAMGMLVDQGKLDWDDKVIKYLPWFKMSDEYVTAHLTLRDLFVHHSGLPGYANDLLLFPPSTFTRKELLSKLKDVKLTHDFRTVYAYDNILYLAAAEVIEVVSGTKWEDFVKLKIFQKVGMNRSISRFSTLRQQENVAYAHELSKGKLRVVATFFDQNIGDASNPAGGIASSALDMSKWLITQLDSGQAPDHHRLFKANTNANLVHFHGDLFIVNYKSENMGEGPFLSFSLNPDRTIREAKFISSFSGADRDFEDLVIKPDPKTILDTADLKKRIKVETDKHKNAGFAVAFRELNTGETFLINDKTSFHAASTMKTPVMAEVFKQAEKGKFAITDSIKVYNAFKSIAGGSRYSLKAEDDSEQDLYKKIGTKVTFEDLLLLMITKSSNLATNILIDIVGAKNVNKTMRSIGANDIQVLRGVEDGKAFEKGLNNTVTAYDLMLLFERIGDGKMVSKKASDAMIAILMQQTFRSVIPARLPKEVRVANKTGSIKGIYNDSGIVYLPDGRKYVVVLLSRGVEEAAAKKTLAAISEYIYNYVAHQ